MKLHHEDLTEQIIGSAIEVHQELGPGLLESAYKECLCWELRERGLSFQRQVDLPIVYKGVSLDCAYRIDLLVEDQVLLELKSVEKVLPIHIAQLMTYLRLREIQVGLLMNFNVGLLKDGIIRRVM